MIVIKLCRILNDKLLNPQAIITPQYFLYMWIYVTFVLYKSCTQTFKASMWGEEETEEQTWMKGQPEGMRQQRRKRWTQFPICEDMTGEYNLWDLDRWKRMNIQILTITSRSQAQVTLRNSASALWFTTGQQCLTHNKYFIVFWQWILVTLIHKWQQLNMSSFTCMPP